MNAPNEQTAAEVIREARNVLFERGWAQNAYTAGDGSVCIRKAIRLADARDAAQVEYRGSIARDCCEALSAALGDPSVLAGLAFNDLPSTTFDDVLEVLDRAEKIAEAAS